MAYLSFPSRRTRRWTVIFFCSAAWSLCVYTEFSLFSIGTIRFRESVMRL